MVIPSTPQTINKELPGDDARVTDQASDIEAAELADTAPVVLREESPAVSSSSEGETALPAMAPEAPAAGPEGGAAGPEGRGEMEATGEAMPGAPAEAPLVEAVEGLRARLRKPKKLTAGAVPQVRDTVTRKVEKIMEEGLKDAFQALTPVQKQEFKMKGEETARKIRDLLRDAHVKVKKIFRLLLQWLKLLPGVNRFFLEQEAKIKADKIIALKHYSDSKN